MIADPIEGISNILGGRRMLGKLNSSLELHGRVTAGLPFGSLQALGRQVDVSPAKLAALLGIPPATYDRRRRTGHLSAAESEAVSRVARILVLGTNLFGSIQKTWDWLLRSNRGFGGAKPIDLLRSEIGGREVEATIGRRLYGGYD